MATQELVRRWLGTDADTPSGRAWGAVVLADYSDLAETLERHGEQATAGAERGDTRAVTMLLDAGADPGEEGQRTHGRYTDGVGHRGRLARVCAVDLNGTREAGNRTA